MVLVYVSCHPATFAENAAKFVAAGYELEYVQPVDMFPNTPHIEAVARLVRDQARAAAVLAAAKATATADRRTGASAPPQPDQYGGWARYHSPSERNADQNARLADCSSSD
jgi:hypothetical protein